MSTLRISNIEAKSVPASATTDEKIKITNSSGDTLVFLDGKTSGITTVGINTTDGNITFDANSNVVVTGIITATKFVGTIEPTDLTVSGKVSVGGSVTAATFYGNGANLTGITQTTINNNADNRVITGSGTANTLEAESTLTYDGTNLDLGDGKYVRLGASNDFQMWHNGGTGNTNIKQVTGSMYFYTGSDLNMLIRDGTSVDLYYANSKKFETTANGAKISGTTTAFLEITTTNGAYNPMFRGSNGDRTFDTGLRGDSGDAWCVYDVTASDNRFMIDTSGNVLIPNDNAALKFGAGNDAELYFDGTDMNIKATTNVQNVNIWTQGVKKYQFTDGMLRPLSDNSYDLGQSSLRWRNIYTGDLHCSNKGSSNDVDGTWGDFTIQEGESDLFLINNRSGKKYKFNLTEVS